MIEMRLQGTAELQRIARRIREADRNMGRELRDALNQAVKPLEAAVKAEVPARMPSGYAPVLAGDLKLTISTHGGSGLTVRASARGRAVEALDRGVLKHPVFGNRRKWARQRIRAGFFSDPMRRGAHLVRAEVVRAVDAVVRRIQG